MPELVGIVRTAAEVPGVTRARAYGSAGPIGQTACLLSLQTGASLSPSLFFFERVCALGM